MRKEYIIFTSSGGNNCKTTKKGNSCRLKTNKIHQTGALVPPCTLKLQKSAHTHCQHSGASSPTLPSYNKRQDIETNKQTRNTRENQKELSVPELFHQVNNKIFIAHPENTALLYVQMKEQNIAYQNNTMQFDTNFPHYSNKEKAVKRIQQS